MTDLWKKIWQFLKRKGWYLTLLITSTLYVLYYRHDIHQLNEWNAKNFIFILWLLLLFWPLFSEMEFLGVKVKKEVEQATEEVNKNVQNLQAQIEQIRISNTIKNNISISLPLPSEQKISDMRKVTRHMYVEDTNGAANDPIIMNGDKNVYLFQVRLKIENTLRALCEKVGYTKNIPISIREMTTFLAQIELIDGITFDMITQVTRIANRGVHGEIISDEYMSFVNEMYPKIIRQLTENSDQLKYMTCPRCKYSGYSVYENVCPQCGYISDED